MRVLKSTLLVCLAASLPLLTSCELALANPIAATRNESANGGVTLTADMLTGAENALVAEQSEQLGNTDGSYTDTEVDYAIRELMVASDVSFLGFDCAILPASSSAEEMLILSSTEQATNSIAVTPFAVPEVAVANLDLNNSDVSFLDSDCAILPASSKLQNALNLSRSTEQEATCSSTEQVDTANINSTAIRPSSLLDSPGSTLVHNLGAAFDTGI